MDTDQDAEDAATARLDLLEQIAASTAEQLADVLQEQEHEVGLLTIEVVRLGEVIETVHQTVDPVLNRPKSAE